MRRTRLACACGVAALALAACDQPLAPGRAAPAQVAYEPGQAGTVDHALCLLGFTGAPLEPLASGHHVITGQLNGQPARFILDTGANRSVVHSAHADAFGLTARRAAPGVAMGLGGALRASMANIESLSLGGVDIRQGSLMLADLSQMEAVLGRLSGEPVHGIIGQDVMTEHRAVVDVARHVLHLQAQDADPAPVPAERCEAQAAAG